MQRARRLLLGLLVIGAGGSAPRRVAAQMTGSGAPVLLQLRPRPGDLLHLRLDQTIEMGVSPRPEEDSTTTDVTTLVMLARLTVESADVDGATVMAVADSVRTESSGSYQSDVLRQARALQGQRFRFRVSPDGSTAVTGVDAWAGPAVGTLLSQLPATLPSEPVMPGASWNRSVDIPLAVSAEGKTTATLTAVFHLDSLSKNGEFAYLSMKGRLVRSGPTQPSAPGKKGESGFVQTSGSVTASLLLDRRRGWIADAKTLISLRSLVTGKNAKGGETAPLRVRMKITQWMRVM